MDQPFLDKNDIVTFLQNTSIFCRWEKHIIEELASILKVIYLDGGQILIRENEIGNSLYIIQSGRLRATKMQDNGKPVTIGEMGRGEIVGEIALFLNQPRAATVHAIRDSLLFELNQDAFEKFSQAYPGAVLDIAKLCVKQLTKKKISHTRSNIVTIAFVPAGSNPLFSPFVEKIAALFNEIVPTCYLNQQSFNQLRGNISAQTALAHKKNAEIVTWLHDLETKYQYIFYETDLMLSEWTLRCLRQADRIILVGLFSEDPSLNDIEKELLRLINRTHVGIDLILLHRYSQSPKNTVAWLEPRNIDEHHHIHFDAREDYEKIIRFMRGRAVGLVLSGGGAPVFSYIGLFRALEELNFKFDMAAGTSAGAFIAGFYAAGMTYHEMLERIRAGVKNYKPARNYTLPLLSLFNGKDVFNNLYGAFGTLKIEDLWTKYFCVSSNLSRYELSVHTRGLLWKSIRASVAIPTLFPPVVDEQGELHVDGAIINNLPVDVMREYIGDGKILALGYSTDKLGKFESLSPVASGWKLFYDRIFKVNQDKQVPNIITVALSSMMLSSAVYSEKMINEADYYIDLAFQNAKLLDVHSVELLIEHSYQICRTQLQKFLELNSRG